MADIAEGPESDFASNVKGTSTPINEDSPSLESNRGNVPGEHSRTFDPSASVVETVGGEMSGGGGVTEGGEVALTVGGEKVLDGVGGEVVLTLEGVGVEGEVVSTLQGVGIEGEVVSTLDSDGERDEIVLPGEREVTHAALKGDVVLTSEGSGVAMTDKEEMVPEQNQSSQGREEITDHMH